MPENRPSLGNYAIHTAREGFSSILHTTSGEIMHSRTPPMEEARHLYVEQSHLATRLTQDLDLREPLVIWDVGLGAAANAMAAIECCEAQAAIQTVRDLHIVSFENDLDSLRLALRHPERFPALRHEAPAALLEHGEWKSTLQLGLRWTLIPGDWPVTMAQSPFAPDIIFYDMFSPKVCPEAWTLRAFEDLFVRCRGRAVELFTYTCSTASRSAMLLAGFYVACGRNAGEKLETTIALTPEAACKAPLRDLLSADWLAKWKRSGARFPAELPAADHPVFEVRILHHPQFGLFAESSSDRLSQE